MSDFDYSAVPATRTSLLPSSPETSCSETSCCQDIKLPLNLLYQPPLEQPVALTAANAREDLRQTIQGTTRTYWLAVLDADMARTLGMQRVTVSTATGRVLHRDPPLFAAA